MTFITFFVILSFLVLVHELGHFLVARKHKIKVEEFGLGLPPRAKVLFRKGDTEYTLNWLPLGGFVRLLGEDYEQLSPKEKKRAFFAQSGWKRAQVLLAGVFSNILFGIVAFSLVFSITGIPKTEGTRVVVTGVSDGSPADLADIQQGDVFLQVESEPIDDVEEFTRLVQDRKGQMVNFRVGRLSFNGEIEDEVRMLQMIPRESPPQGEGSLGVVIGAIPQVRYERLPVYLAPIYGVWEGFKEAFFWGREVLRGLVMIFQDVFRGKAPEGVAGPIGIYQLTGEVRKTGIIPLIQFMGVLSVNLAIFNLLPFPALDGGRLFFIGVEKIFGKKRTRKVERWVHGLGFFVLIMLLLLITLQDLRRIFNV